MLRDGTSGGEATWYGDGREAGREALLQSTRDSWREADREALHDERCQQLHRRLKRIVEARGALDAQEAEALRDADRLRVWRHYGYASQIEYMEIEMGYSPRAALERLRVAKAIVELPAIADAMARGELSFSAGRELTRVASAETERLWLEAANDKNARQIASLVSGHKHGDKPTDPVNPKLRTQRVSYDHIDGETVALLRQARQILERELGERIDDNGFLRAMGRMVIDGARAPERTHAPYQIAVTTCAECKRGWQDGGGIVVEMSAPALEVALCDAAHIGSVDVPTGSEPAARTKSPGAPGAQRPNAPREKRPTAPRTQRPNAPRAKSAIPPALRRRVRARDHHTCRVPWCRSSRNVDEHHLRPVSEGGEHALENLITLCESHHMAHHDGALLIEGDACAPTFTRRAQSSFDHAERAIDTAKALRTLGFDKHEVKNAIDRTRTHVGTTELSLEKWIKIALGYCPKPRS